MAVTKQAYDRARYLGHRSDLLAQKRAAYTAIEERRKNLWRKYRITPEEFDLRLTQQGGTCAICQRPDPRGPHKAFVVDHDHKTGTVRGILCNPCNVGLGALGDTPASLLRAVEYLKCLA